MRGSFLRLGLGALALVLASGCATVKNLDPKDPWESVNRGTHTANLVLDYFVTKPIAKAYVFVVPQVFRDMVTNVYNNLGEVGNAANNLLQGKPAAVLKDTARFAVNSIFGFGGIADVASEMGMTRSNEDFGQTLSIWGVPSGPYLVLPLFGPSTVRDAVGRVPDSLMTATRFLPNEPDRWMATGANLVNLRANLLPLDKVIEQSATDPYVFMRDAYLQRRINLIYDGNPPEELPKYEKEKDE